MIAQADEKASLKYKSLWDDLKTLEEEKEKANDCFKKGNFDGAIDLYSKLLELESTNKSFTSTILANRALCLQKKGKTFEALSDLNKSISINENYWKAYYRRATIYISLKNAEKAKEDLQKVIQLDSSKNFLTKIIEKLFYY